ncbi:MAG: hypothetical protein IKI89_06070 [Bacteroidales bacterium]|nr:hypothetical protein [Bacteroidales bacterium]
MVIEYRQNEKAPYISGGIRHTLSTQTDPAKGLGAAIDFLAEKCRRWAVAANPNRPRPIVEKIYYTVGENGGRYDRITDVPELMVTLPGTKAEREILLVAHVDTRVIDVMDSTAFAPFLLTVVRDCLLWQNKKCLNL